MSLSEVILLLAGLGLGAAEEAVAGAGSYTAPEPLQIEYQAPATEFQPPQFEAPQQQYGVPQQQYGVPQQQYGVPQQQYEVPQPQYEAPQPQYGAPKPPPMAHYAPPHAGYDSYHHGMKSFFSKGGSTFLGKFGYDWVFTGLMVAGMVILLSIIGVVTVPGLPFTSDILPSVTELFKARHLDMARSLAGPLLDSNLLAELPEVVEVADFVETAIERARRFIAEFQH